MNVKFKILISLLLLILVFNIGVISANEDISDDISSSQDIANVAEDVSADEIVSSSEPINDDYNETLGSSEEDVLGAEATSFTALQEKINDAEGDVVELDKNYAYDSKFDSTLISGIVINKKLTIDGMGKYSVDGGSTARIFRVQSANVTFQNITLKNAYWKRNDSLATNQHHGGAIWFDSNSKYAKLINCNFTNNRIFESDAYNSYGGAVFWDGRDNFTVINCNFKWTTNTYGARCGAGIFTQGSNVLIFNSTFDNMRTEDTYGASIYANSNAYSNITIIDCKFLNSWTGNTYSAIRVDYKENITVYNNLFYKHYCRNGQIYVNGAKHVNISCNNFTDYNCSYEAGIYIYGVSDDVYIGYNKFENIFGALSGNITAYGYRIMNLRAGVTATGNATIEYNNLTNIILPNHQNTAVGIDIQGFAYTNIHNNYFINLTSRCIGVIKSTAPVYIENNTFYGYYLNARGGDADVLRGMAIWASNYTYIKNNTFECGSLRELVDIPYSVDGVIYISDTGSAHIENNTFRDNNITVSVLSHTGVISNNGNNTNITNNRFYDSDCNGALGGFIYNTGSNVLIYNNNFTNAIAKTGGAIYSTGDSLSVIDNNFTNINATVDGGAFYISGQNVNIIHNAFKDIHAGSNYGVIYLDTQEGSYLHDNTYVDNYAADQGVLAIGSGVNIDNENFTNNYVTNGQAGTILIMGDNNNISNININKTSALTGGAIYNKGNNNKLDTITINSTVATSGHGGAIYSIGDYLNITGLNVYSSSAAVDGGAVYNSGTNGELSNSEFTDISAGNNGGVIFWSGAYGTISNINIKDAYAGSDGGAIYVTASDCLINYLTVNNVHATVGGAVYCVGARSNLTDSSFTNVYANGDGGAIYWTGSNTNLTNIDFKHINSTANGGAIYGTGVNSFLVDLDFEDVNATGNGGAINWAGAESILNDLDFINVASDANGGALFITGDKSRFNKGSLKFVHSNGNGGAVYWTSSSSNMTDVVFVNCSSTDMGGAVYWTGSNSNVSDSTFINCSASNGGAILWNAGLGRISDSQFENNTANGNGGAVYWIGSDAKLYDLTFYNNNASFKGGAINILGNDEILYGISANDNWAGVDGGAIIMDGSNCELSDANFSGNDAGVQAGAVFWAGNNGILYDVDFTDNSAGIGGALYWSADNANITDVRFTGNNATSTGGALYMGGLTGGNLVDCIFIDNNATSTGGAIYWAGSNGNLSHCEFNSAHAESGGAIYWTGDNAVLSVLNFTNVNADENGGILYISALNVTVLNSDFYNSSAGSGGAIYWTGSEGILINNVFENNSASMNGGAVYWIGNNANITDVNFTNNTAYIDGGALYIISYGAMLNNIDFFNNTAYNYGGAVYWGGTGNISDSDFEFNHGFSGSAVYNSGSLNIKSTVVLNNKANISSIEFVKVEETVNMFVDTIVYGYDNFLNAIWTTSDNIMVNDVTYYGLNGENTTDTDWTRPVEGVSTTDLYFDSRLPGVPITVSYVHDGVEVMSYNGKTDLWGNYSYFGSKPAEGNYNVTAIHNDDNYYFGTVYSEILGIGLIVPNVTVSLSEREVYYDSEVFISGSVIAMDTQGHLFIVYGDADIYVDGEFINLTIPVNDGRFFKTTKLPDKFNVGLHNISAYFYNGEDPSGRDIASGYSDSAYYFNIIKNFMPSIVDISTSSSTYYVDDAFNITIVGPAQYRGDIQYVAGSVTGYCQLVNGTVDIPVSYQEDGTVNVLVYVLGDDNYLPSSGSYSFNIIKKDCSIVFDKISGTSIGSINVGDDAIIGVNLSVADAKGSVIVSVDDVYYSLPINGSFVALNVSNLASGVHTVTAEYFGDNKYNPARLITATLTVNKVNIDLFNVAVDEPDVYVGDSATFTISLSASDNVSYPFNGIVNATFDGLVHTVLIENGVGYLTVDNLAYKNYSLRVDYGGDYQFNTKSFTVNNVVNVSKIATDVNVTPANPVIPVGGNVVFDICVNSSKYNVTGSVTVKVAGREYIVYINEGVGSLNVSDLKYDADPYAVDIVYGGDGQFMDSNISIFINVYKFDVSSIDIRVNDSIYVGEDALLNISVDSGSVEFNDFVIVKVNGSEYKVYVSNGTALFDIHGLEYSSTPYLIEVSYNGSDVFNPYSGVVTDTVTVKKCDINNIEVTVNSPVSVGDDVYINIDMDSDKLTVNGFVTVKVNNKEYNVSIIDNHGVLMLTGLDEGDYDVFVDYAGDSAFNSFNDYSSHSAAVIEVAKISTSINMNDVIINVGNVAVIVARVNNSMATGNVSFIVDNIEYVKGVVDGVATLEVYNLNTSANNTIYAKYSGDYRFHDSSTTASLEVNKISDQAIISVYDLIAGETEDVVIVLPSDVSNGTIVVKFNDTPIDDYVINNNVITFNRSIQSAGVYSVNVSVVDDVKYNTITASSEFIAYLNDDYDIYVNIDNVVFGENATVKVTLPSDATDGIVRIDGVDYSVANVRNGIVIPCVDFTGVYTVDVQYLNSSKYDSKYVSGTYKVYKANSNVSIDMNDTFFVGEDIHFVVNAVSSTGEITVTILNNVYHPDNATDYVINGGLANATYIVIVKLAGDDNYYASDISKVIMVNKKDVSLLLGDVDSPFNVGDNVAINAIFNNNVSGNVIFSVNNVNYTVNVNSDDHVLFNYVPNHNGTYNVSVFYLGDDKYNTNDVTRNNYFVVNKIDTTLIITVEPIHVGQDALINVEVISNEATGRVNITVNNRSYNVALNNGKGSVSVSGLTNSTNNIINGYYAGDDKYGSSSNVSGVVVNKVNIANVIINNQEIYAGENALLDVYILPELDSYLVNGFVTVTVDNGKYNVSIVNNTGRLNVSGLEYGVHYVDVSYAGDEIYNSYLKVNVSNVTVNKVDINYIDVSVVNPIIYIGDDGVFNIKVNPRLDNYLVNGFVIFSINGTSYNVAIINNTGSLIVHGLGIGSHLASVSYAGDNVYNAYEIANVSSITVNRIPIDISALPTSQTIFVGDVAELNISVVPSVDNRVLNGFITVYVENTPYNVSITNNTGKLFVNDLLNGVYNVNAFYAGGDEFELKYALHVSSITVNKRPTSIHIENVVLNVGDVANIVAIVSNSTVTGSMTFIVDNNEYVVGIVDGVAHLNVSGLNTSANKTITAIYSGDYKFVNSTATALLDISKVNSNANIVVYNITAGETETVIITLPDDVTNGTITVKFNDVEVADYNRDNNVISFNRTLQVSGDYTVSVSVVDDCKYYDFDNSTMFTVSKVAPENYTIVIFVNDTYVFENISVVIALPNDANGTLSLSVDDKINDSVSIVNGIASYDIGNLSYGNHTITVTYGNDKYDTKTVSTNVFVSKIASSISITNPVDPRVAHDIIVNVTPIGSTGAITVTINNKTYNVTDRSWVNASGLLEGDYTVVVILAEDENYLESTNNSVFIVSRNNVSMRLNNVSGDLLVDSPIVLRVDLTENVTGSVIFNVNNMNYTVNITESDYAEYTWVPMNEGNVIVSASYSGNDTYYPCGCEDITFTVSRNLAEFVDVIVSDIMVDDVENITVTLNVTDVTGAVIFNVNGSEYESNVLGGLAFLSIPDLLSGNYVVSVYYLGDNKYYPVAPYVTEFNVYKYDSPIDITVEDIMVLDNATVIVTLPNEINDLITISVADESINMVLVNGSASWTIGDLPAGNYTVSVSYSGNSKYNSNTSTSSFAVSKYDSVFDVDVSDVFWTGDDNNISMVLSDDASGDVTVSINGTDYVLPVVNGTVDFSLPELVPGDYEAVIKYGGDYKYDSVSKDFNFTVIDNCPIIESGDVVKYYKGSQRLRVNLTNVRGDKLSGEAIYITINGVTYTRVTNENGSLSLPINLPTGDYAVDIIYDSTGYGLINKTVNVSVLSTVVSEDLIKVYHNASQFYARFLDSEGNALVNTSVKFNINGVFYTRTTDSDGWAKLNINLPQGEYIITSYNPVTDESHSNVINVLPKITENYDLTKVYGDGTPFSVCIIDDDGDHVGAGEKVSFNINGVYYTRSTNEKGYVSLNINLPEGEYIITTSYEGCTVSNRVTIINGGL